MDFNKYVELIYNLLQPNKELDTMWMEIRDKGLYFCGDAYYGILRKNEVVSLIKDLIYYYIKLEELENDK